mgnify:CR=1 FL=1
MERKTLNARVLRYSIPVFKKFSGSEQGRSVQFSLIEQPGWATSSSVRGCSKLKVKPMVLKILVIDDEPEIIRLVETWLAEKPYKVIGAGDGKTGLEAAVREHPDLILLDIMMTGMKGHEVLRALKVNAETSTIPVIMLSQKLGTSSILDAQDYGASDYLTKPFLPEELLKTIRMYA